jgi:hypothetical protein
MASASPRSRRPVGSCAWFCLGHIGQLNKALRQVLLRALSLVGVGEVLTLAFDSTYVRSRFSRRQGADPTYLKRYALHPSCASSPGSVKGARAQLWPSAGPTPVPPYR